MNYLSAIIYISMILDFNELVNGSSLSAHGCVGARVTSFIAVHFAKQNTDSVSLGRGGKRKLY